MSKDLFDIGSKLAGCPDVRTYVPGKRLRVFFTCPDVTCHSPLEAECRMFIRQNLGEDVHIMKHEAETCDMCVYIPREDKRVSRGMWSEIETFFSRFAEEARVYEFDATEQQLIARNPTYFRNPRRVVT